MVNKKTSEITQFINEKNPLGLWVSSFEWGIFTNKKQSNEPSEKHLTKKDFSFHYNIEYLQNGLIFSMRFTNNSKEERQVNSAMLGDFKLSSKKAIPLTWKILENGFLQSSFAGYLSTFNVSKLHRFISGRDSNLYSYENKFGYLPKSIVSEWFTRLKAPHGDIVIGAISTGHQFTQVYFKREGIADLRFRINCQFDKKIMTPGETFETEKIYIGFGEDNKTLNRFAKLIAKEMGVKSLKRNVTGINCSFYAFGNIVTEEIVKKEVEFLKTKKEEIPIEYVQLDAGYSPWGDWLYHDKHFPNRFHWLVNYLKENGFKAGIWISPFTAMRNTRVFKDHKDWFLCDKKGKPVSARRTYPGDRFLGFFGALDPTNPFVLEYLRDTVKMMTKEFGFSLIKLDFIYAAVMPTSYHKKNITRVEAIREGLALIREAAGDETILMSAISPLSPLVGFIDIARMTIDITSPQLYKVPFLRRVVNKILYEVSHRNLEARSFLNGIIWRNDPDVMIANPKSGFTDKETRKLMELIKETEGPIILGDSVSSLPKERLEKFIYPLFK